MDSILLIAAMKIMLHFRTPKEEPARHSGKENNCHLKS